jgi:hypothetical protein
LKEQNAKAAFTKRALIAGTIVHLIYGKPNESHSFYTVAPLGFFSIHLIAKTSALASLAYSGDILLPWASSVRSCLKSKSGNALQTLALR